MCFWSAPAGFHLMMPLKSDVSCSSVHGSFGSNPGFVGLATKDASGVSAMVESSSSVGVEAFRKLPRAALLRGGIMRS